MKFEGTPFSFSAPKVDVPNPGAEGMKEAVTLKCKSTEEIVSEVNRIIREERQYHADDAEFFFRGESKNYLCDDDSAPLGTAFPCCLDREPGWYKHEREMYEEALRLNVADFRSDQTMAERLARMQHYQLPTRFADISFNALLSAHFASGGGCHSDAERDNGRDGFVRVIKVAKYKMKSFTSDVIIAISHLPLIDADDILPSQEHGLGSLVYEVKNGERPAFWYESEAPATGRQLRDEIRQVWAFKPTMNSARIRSQGGAFLAFGCYDKKQPLSPSFSPADYDNPNAPSCGIKQIGYVQIAAEAKAKIREELRRFGMSDAIAYPEISNVSEEIRDRFIKEKE